jgi:hypothetical protein
MSEGFWIGKPERKTPLGRTMLTWEGNIKMDFKEMGWEVADWVRLAKERGQYSLTYAKDSFRFPLSPMHSKCITHLM